MITEDYISFEVAKLLKEKGFDEPCLSFFWTEDSGFGVEYCDRPFTNRQLYSEQTLRPTLQMAMKWLRNTYNLFINVDWDSENFYFVIITDMIKGDYVKADISGNEYKSYEEATEAAIKYCLENLI